MLHHPIVLIEALNRVGPEKVPTVLPPVSILLDPDVGLWNPPTRYSTTARVNVTTSPAAYPIGQADLVDGPETSGMQR